MRFSLCWVWLGLALTVAASAEPLTVGETFLLPSAVLKEQRRINVYLPPAYDGKAPLPVLYMPDGGVAEDFLHIMGLVQVLSGNGAMRPVVLVGIENTERRRDLTGPTDDPEDRKVAPRVGGSAAFRLFLRNELMPEIAKRYRVSDERAIVGESFAGLFVLETMLLEPDLFDTYIAIDPSLWWNKQELTKRTEGLLAKWPKKRKALFLAASDAQGNGEVVKAFADEIGKDAPPGLTWYYEPMPAETHMTIFHPAALKGFRAALRRE